jgi:TPP-dependent pyruvate/acetoin dehydrogenase alpha subunit
MTEKLAGQAEFDLITKGIDDEIETAVKYAMASPLPKPEDALEDLFVAPI